MTSDKARLVPRPSVAPYPQHPLHEYLLRAAERIGSKTAVVDGAQKLTFLQLKERTASLASDLAGMGIGKGDRVAIFAPNCWEYVASFYAISWIGAVVTTLNPSYREREVEFQLHGQRCQGHHPGRVLCTQSSILCSPALRNSSM